MNTPAAHEHPPAEVHLGRPGGARSDHVVRARLDHDADA